MHLDILQQPEDMTETAVQFKRVHNKLGTLGVTISSTAMNKADQEERSDNAALQELLGHLYSVDYKFVTVSPVTHAIVNCRPSSVVARSLTDVFGWSRPFGSGLLPTALHESLSKSGAVVEHEGLWLSRVRVSSIGDLLFIHSAFPTLDPQAVFFGPDTYRFCRAISSHIHSSSLPRSMLDIGCGTGAGGIIGASLGIPRVRFSDINDDALAFAELNATAAGLTDVEFVHSDLFDNLPGNYDLIAANPPYLNDSLHRAYRHGGGAFGSALSVRIAHEAITRLAPGGSLLLYTGAPIVDGKSPLKEELRCAFDASVRWTYEEIDPDVFGDELETDAYGSVDRIAAVLIIATMTGK